MSIDRNSLDEVKKKLGITLPTEYEQLVQNIPADIPDATELQISTDSDWLVGMNAELRDKPSFFFGREAEWPPFYFVIGEDGNGNAYYLDLREQTNPAVYFLHHEKPNKDHVLSAATVAEWVNVVRTELLD